jgi:hypothetical protein
MATQGKNRKLHKLEPFIKKALNKDYTHIPFETLKISTATIDARLMENSNINFELLSVLLPCIPKETQIQNPNTVWPIGTITCIKHGTTVIGLSPTDGTKAFKNSTMIWIQLREKRISMKISTNSIHMTGCKKLEQAAEAIRLFHTYLTILEKEKDIKLYGDFPYAVRFDVNMINYNFNLGVAIDLEAFDLFVAREFSTVVFSPYDHNVHGNTMPLKCEELCTTYTIHDNGQICMCVSEPEITKAMHNLAKGYEIFYIMLKAFRDSQNEHL